jgi:hypothetical protein
LQQTQGNLHLLVVFGYTMVSSEPQQLPRQTLWHRQTRVLCQQLKDRCETHGLPTQQAGMEIGMRIHQVGHMPHLDLPDPRPADRVGVVGLQRKRR